VYSVIKYVIACVAILDCSAVIHITTQAYIWTIVDSEKWSTKNLYYSIQVDNQPFSVTKGDNFVWQNI
jgi:hypothetical protein